MEILAVIKAKQYPRMLNMQLYYFYELVRALDGTLWWERIPPKRKPTHGIFPFLGELDIMDIADHYFVLYNEDHFNKTIELDFRATRAN